MFGRHSIFYVLIVAFAFISSSLAETEFKCKFGNEIQRFTNSGYEVVVCSYGSSPQKINGGWWRGSGLAFYKVSNDKNMPSSLIKDHSEYYPNLDYRVGINMVEFILYTYNPVENKFINVPFIKEIIIMNTEPVDIKRELLICTPKPNPKELDSLINILSMHHETFIDSYPDYTKRGYILESSLYKLRNYGLKQPQEMLDRLSDFDHAWWNSGGAVAEVLKDVRAELQIINSLVRK